MRLGILDVEKKISKQLSTCQTSARLLESKEVIKENDLNDLDALLICKSSNFGIKEICEWVIKIKMNRYVPIWVATSEKQLEEKNVYLQLGVCGIFEGNYTVEEMHLSISNSLNTMKLYPQTKVKESQFFQLDPLKLSLSIEETSISLTRLEYFLLELLYENKEEVCTYETLAVSLLGDQFDLASETGQYRVANIVCKLRAKLAKASGGKQDLIRTVRSRGYMLTLSA